MAVAAFFIIRVVLGADNIRFYVPILSGIVAGILIGYFTEYFTSDSYQPTKDLAKSAETGAGTIIIDGLALGMKSTAIPVIVVAISILVSYFAVGGVANFNYGIFGIALSAVGMLSTLGITLATDAYGPVADNAGGIAEMAGMPEHVRERTDALDSLGNTTAATGKGFAIGSAALTALALIAAYAQQVEQIALVEGLGNILNLSILNPNVLIGLLIGAMIPFLFSSFTMSAVGRSAQAVVLEVRRQFREIPGIMDGTAKADHRQCVEICTESSLKEMIKPSLLGIVTPVIVGLVLGVNGVAGMLGGATASGFVLALMMSNAGGAWDNAKKYIETGAHGGSGSEAHKAAVVGDTVGDPFKDTSGPSINILIKLLSTVAIIFCAVFVKYSIF